MKGIKTALKWVDRALVVSPYRIALCTSKSKFRRELKRLKVPVGDWPEWIEDGKDAMVHFLRCPKPYCLCCIVCIDKDAGHTPLEAIGLLLHEAVHIWQHSCEEINELEPSKEFEAYSIQTVAQRLIEAYK
jgi:hypothetical protein